MKIIKICKAFSFSTTVLNLNAMEEQINNAYTEKNTQYPTDSLDLNNIFSVPNDNMLYSEKNEDINKDEEEKEGNISYENLLKSIDNIVFPDENNSEKNEDINKDEEEKEGNISDENLLGSINNIDVPDENNSEKNEDVNEDEEEKEENILYKNLFKSINNIVFPTKKKIKKKRKNKKNRLKNYNKRKGDWLCEFCNNINFKFRTECNICGYEKPSQNI